MLVRFSPLLLLAGMTLTLAACGSKGTEPTLSALEGTASTTSAGSISGATVELLYHGSGATATEEGTAQGSTTTNSSGVFRFESLQPGWYKVTIFWTVGTITRDHGALELHSGFLVAHYSGGGALALGPTFSFPVTSSVSFVYDN